MLETFLEDTAALASTVYAASLQEEGETEDITGTFHVLAEQGRETLAIFR